MFIGIDLGTSSVKTILIDEKQNTLVSKTETISIENPKNGYYEQNPEEWYQATVKCFGYLKKQKADILAFKRDENLIIPDNIDYDKFSGLSNEVKAKFKEIRPKTMGQALRIDGITPAAVYILLSHVKRKSIKHIA